MSPDVWEGIVGGAVISIPISIGVGLNLSRIQQWIDQRSQTSREKTRERLKDQYEDVLYYALHTDMMLGKMINAATFLLLYVFVLVLCSLLSPIMRDVTQVVPLHGIPRVNAITILTVSFVALVFVISAMTVAVFKLAIDSYLLYHRVRFFTTYTKSIPDDIRQHKMETIIADSAWERAIPGLHLARSHYSEQSQTPPEDME
jgi:hypothetical protein